MSTHEAIIRGQTANHRGLVVKSMGDGFMLTFPSAGRGIHCAIGIQKALVEHNRNQPKAPISVRTGLSVGEPIRDGDDMFGTSVIIAARIAAEAHGRQVLVSDIVHALASTSGDFDFQPVGEMELKGFSGTQHIFEVVWR